LVPVSTQLPGAHGLGVQSSLSMQPPAPLPTKPLAHALQVESVALLHVTALHPASEVQAVHVVPSLN